MQTHSDPSADIQSNPWREEWKSTGDLGVEGHLANKW